MLQVGAKLLPVKRRERGLTLIELLVALSINSIIIIMILMLWKNLGQHVSRNSQKATFQSEAQHIFNIISTTLNQTRAVVAWNSNRISVLIGNKSEEEILEFSGNEFKKNGRPLTTGSTSTHVSEFKIEQKGSSWSNNDKYQVLTIQCTIKDKQSNTQKFSMDFVLPSTNDKDRSTNVF